MDESNARTNPRKRNVNNIFQRALFGLNQNQSRSGNRSPKRARVVVDKSQSPQSSDVQSSHSTNRHSSSRTFTSFSNDSSPNRNFMHDRRRRVDDHSKSIRHTPETRLFGNRSNRGGGVGRGKSINFTTKTRRKQQQQSNGFSNSNDDNPFVTGSHSGNKSNQIRNSKHGFNPFLQQNGNRNGRGHQRGHNNNNHHRSKHQKKTKGRGHNNNNHSNNNNNKNQYEYVEMCRHRKLWTDLVGDHEGLLSQLNLCRDTSYFITSNSIAHKISNIIAILLNEYRISNGSNASNLDESPIKILDGLSCIGGNTYSFAKVFASPNHEIYGNELDEERYNALEHNMKVFEENGLIDYGERLQFFNLDFLTLHQSLGQETCDAMDVVFLDPEWNRNDDYKQTNRGLIHLFDIGPLHLYQAVDKIISEWYRNVKIVAVKVAKNWDQQFILRKLQKCKLIESKCFRIGQVSFHNQKLVLIVRTFGNDETEEEEDEDEDVDITEDEEQKHRSFEEILAELPALTNTTGSNSIRDTISVEVLS